MNPPDRSPTGVSALMERRAGPWDRRLALALLGFSACVLVAILPIARQPWLPIPAFISAHQSAVAVNALVTAILLFGLHRELRRAALLWLAGAYLFTACAVVAHALSFPGLFGPGNMVGGEQTTVWLWMAWHLALPVAAIAYARAAGGAQRHRSGGSGVMVGLVMLVPLAAAGLVILMATVGHDALPRLLVGNAYIDGVTRPVLALPLALCLIAAVMLTVRTRLTDALDLWLAVSMGAMAVEILLSAVVNSGRFQAGFYVGRLYGLLACSTVLATLLLATIAAQGRVARSLAAERDAALTEARQVAERLRLAGEAGGVGAWEGDPVTGERRWSRVTYRIWGIEPETPITPDLLLGLIDPTDRARVRDALTPPPAPGELREVEFRIVRPADGARRWILSRVEALADPETGQPVRFVGIMLDTTAQHDIQDTLRQSEAYWRGLFEALHEGLVVGEVVRDAAGLAIDWRFVDMNAAWERLTGLSRANARGRTLREVLPGVEDIWIESCVRVAETGTPENLMQPVEALGRWYQSHTFRIGPDRFAVLFLDVTEQRRIEAEVRDSRAQLQLVLDNIPVAVVLAAAPSGRILFGNSGVERVFRHKLRRSDDPDAYVEWESYHSDGRRVEGRDYPLARVLATGEAASGEYEYACGDGVRRWIRIEGAPVRDEHDALTGALVVCVDIDARRRTEAALALSEAALRHLNERLETRVRDEVVAREAAQAQLAHAQRMEALGQLAGGIAHDINNVLHAVGGGAALIERRPSDPDAVRRIARMVVEATERGSAVTRRLLAFSRRGDLRAEPLEPLAVLNSIREILVHTLGAGIAVRVEAEPGGPSILADKGQLETVLVNLAANARDAMGGQGTIVLAATPLADPTSERPDRRPSGRFVRLSVTDDGSGMPPEVLARATEPFFTTKAQGKGTGLGLAMARGFAEQSGGGLAVESEPGRGTTVSLWLPVAEAAAETAGGASGPAAPPGPRLLTGQRRVLLVDDDAIVRAVTTEGLQAAGYAVIAAEAGAAALALLDAGEPVDVIVSDLSMPGMDGLATIHAAQLRRPGLPAILLTGFATGAAELAIDGAISGSFALLRKPVTAEHLSDSIAALLEAPAAAGSTPV